MVSEVTDFSDEDVWEQIKSEDYSLQINLDVNGVVLGQETIKGQTTPSKIYANAMLATGTYHEWDGGPRCSFRQHVWNVIYPGDNSDVELRQTRKALLKGFVTHLKETDHSLLSQVSDQYDQLVAILETSPVFPSLDRLVETLQQRQVRHNLVFRTFGGDGDTIVEYFSRKYPSIKFKRGSFDEDGNFSCASTAERLPFERANELLQTGNWIVQDNFQRWRKGGELGAYGKPFHFSSAPGAKTIPMFFDDNLEIVPKGQKTIVCCYDVSKAEQVSTREASLHLRKVNPIDAALNSNCLVDMVSQVARSILDQQSE